MNDAPELLPVKMVADVEEARGVRWLVEGLWMHEGVGLLGGCPKSCKTWLALDLALSVATGTPALGRYAACEPGSVLLFAAEDSPPMVRQRLSGMARQRGLELTGVPIHLVLASSLRLEAAADQRRLQATVARYRPKLMILDPFVRLSRADENSALEVSAVLAYLRELQRDHHVAILVVHHTRKSTGNNTPAGLALRGSGDFWAWADTTLYLRRNRDSLQLACEHRSAAQPEPVALELCDDSTAGPYLRCCEKETVACEPPPQTCPLTDRILDALRSGDRPWRTDDLRATLRVRTQSVVDALRELENGQRIHRVAGGWDLVVPATVDPVVATTTSPGETEVGSAEAQPAEG